MFWIIIILLIVLFLYLKKKKGNAVEANHIEETGNFRDFKVNVVGITKINGDGTSRADIASRCKKNEQLALIPEPDNKYDKNAVMIMTNSGLQLGYLDSHTAKDLRASLRGTSKMYDKPEAFFIEYDTFLNEDDEELPYCKIMIRRHFKTEINEADKITE